MANTRVYTIDGDTAHIKKRDGSGWKAIDKAVLEGWADKSYSWIADTLEVSAGVAILIFKKLGIEKKAVPVIALKRRVTRGFISYNEDCKAAGIKSERRLYKILGGEEIR
jgi:hypothetical protein